ncbi:MAG TPA: crosslink repair DNA glycosylase YcaQ family protein [Candidatus Limnocylindria bacterium]|nr:crosslink repair DNA glycosylase YcaQ family protein [Candidatus Limnocylindria bacterium]
MSEVDISHRAARRLIIDAQLLGAKRQSPDRRGILATVDQLLWLQLDPTSAVARSHLLVLWSRLGRYDPSDVARLIYKDQRLFEWRAFLYPTRQLPFYRLAMRSTSTKYTNFRRRARWMRANPALRRQVLSRLRREGPLATSAFDGREAVSWHSTGWTNDRNASQMLEFLSAEGRVLVAGRAGQERLWDLTERCVPAKALVSSATPTKLIRDATIRALRALGVATTKQISEMLPGAVRELVLRAIASLVRSGEFVPARVVTDDGTLKGTWYVLAADAERISALERSWSGRTTLLSPFDTLIRDRARTEALFGMRYRIEIYVPPAKRQYGYFAMPILHDDELIGRIDPRVDSEGDALVVNAIHLEPGPKRDVATGRAVAQALGDLAEFTGMSRLIVPAGAGLPGLRLSRG